MTEAPDHSGRFFIVEQDGRILVVKKGDDGSNATEFLNIEARKPHVDNEEGLLSLAFHPGYTSNGLFYIYYNQQNPRRSVISEFKVSATNASQADLASERILLTVPQPYPNHKGGQISFGPDGYLYIALGDGGAGSDPHNNGQNTSALLGKMLRIDVNTRAPGSGPNRKLLEYGIPLDNPFMKSRTVMTFVGKSGRTACGIRGASVGIAKPAIYGPAMWARIIGKKSILSSKAATMAGPVREGRHHFKPGPVGARFIEPVLEYAHRPDQKAEAQFPNHSTGISVTGGYVYRGRQYPTLRGVYVYADYALGTIWGLRLKKGKVIEQGSLLDQPKNIRASPKIMPANCTR